MFVYDDSLVMDCFGNLKCCGQKLRWLGCVDHNTGADWTKCWMTMEAFGT